MPLRLLILNNFVPDASCRHGPSPLMPRVGHCGGRAVNSPSAAICRIGDPLTAACFLTRVEIYRSN